MEEAESNSAALVFLSEAFDHAGNRVFAGHVGRGISHGRFTQDPGNRDEEAFFSGGHHATGFPSQKKCRASIHIHDMGEFRIRGLCCWLDETNAGTVDHGINAAHGIHGSIHDFLRCTGSCKIGSEVGRAGSLKFFRGPTGKKNTISASDESDCYFMPDAAGCACD